MNTIIIGKQKIVPVKINGQIKYFTEQEYVRIIKKEITV